MAKNKINLVELYQKAFNVKGVKYLIDDNSEINSRNFTDNKYFDIDVPVVPVAKAYSLLGVPIYEAFKLSLLSNYVVGQAQTPLKDYTFPDCPLLDISASKNIVTTHIRNRNGSVKEYINTDDYKITIRGLLINYENDDYPDNLVYDLHEIFKINNALSVTNSVLNLLDIFQIVITDIQLPVMEGFNNVQPYVIQCFSDNPLLLTVKDAKQSGVNILR